jgi:glycoside/pentoside/hexuronide:cation symporter, GPH family
MDPRALTRLRLAIYGLPGVPLAALGLPMYVYLPTFYAQDLALGVGSVGAVLLAVRLIDVLTDPLAGHLSDRLPWPDWRRRFGMLLGTPALLLGVWSLFHPPAHSGSAWLLTWAIVAYLGWTLVNVPYTAWGAELSSDYHQRSRLTASREGFMALGTLLALGLPAALGLGRNPAAALHLMAWLVVALLPITLAIAIWRLDETRGTQAHPHWSSGLRLLVANRPLRSLLTLYLLNGLANGLPATLFLLFVRERLQAPDAIGPLLALYFAAGILALPAWLALAKHIGKHHAWSLSMLIAAIGFLPAPWLGPNDLDMYTLLVIVTGLCIGADLALPASIQADVVDVDTAAGGGQRTGLLFGLWGMATKLALALAVGIAFPLLGLAGFVSEVAATQPDSALLSLALLYGVLPLLIKLPCSYFAWRFPLNADTHRIVRERIAERTESA